MTVLPQIDMLQSVLTNGVKVVQVSNYVSLTLASISSRRPCKKVFSTSF